MAAKKGKSTVNESIKQGFGSEFGKRLAMIVFAALTLLALAVWGYVSDSSTIQEFNKSNSAPSNSE